MRHVPPVLQRRARQAHRARRASGPGPAQVAARSVSRCRTAAARRRWRRRALMRSFAGPDPAHDDPAEHAPGGLAGDDAVLVRPLPQVPMQRPGQPAELQTAYVMLADPLSSYVSGATIAVTGGKPII